MLPDALAQAIYDQVGTEHLQDLARARQNLTDRYRGERKKERLMRTHTERLTYLATRMPATYAAVSAAMAALQEACPGLSIETLLDAGAGPATASWAATEAFPSLQHCTMIENDLELSALGRKLAAHGPASLRRAEWLLRDLCALEGSGYYDLVVCSYAMGEIPSGMRKEVIDRLWAMAKKAILIIEPGSMAGFSCIRSTREQLIDLKATIAAPCPHAKPCPMPEGDWCHFSVRLERSRMHKDLKGGTLGYEDEKYSYVAALRSETAVAYEGRVLSPPAKHSGHLQLRLCAREGVIHLRTISKKEGDLYKKARKLEWGGVFEPL